MRCSAVQDLMRHLAIHERRAARLVIATTKGWGRDAGTVYTYTGANWY